MKIRVNLSIKELQVEEFLEIDDRKLEELSEEEIEQTIDIVVRNWVNDAIRLEWETE
jgi:hypothetical protein